MRVSRLAALVALGATVRAGSWPYTRKYANATTPDDEHDDKIPDLFLEWLRFLVNNDPSGQLAASFKHGHIPDHVSSLEQLEQHALNYHVNRSELPKTVWDAIPDDKPLSASEEAAALFDDLDFQLEPACVQKKESYWYRSADGSCNWLKRGEAHIGATGQPRSRDFKQTTYADGVSAPREGPNPRELSNAFFKRKERLYYEHTPLMLGLVEFLMHDVTYSSDSNKEFIEVPIPKGDPAYDPEQYGNKTFKVWRSQPLEGSGTSKQNPRQHVNGATAWLDCSALYGSTPDVVDALRSHQDGKLKSQRGPDGFEYLPFNVDGKPVRTRPGIDIHDLFLGGDVRTNEDWILLSVHTLLLREHNRLCDIMVAQHPDWDDERVYQTVRLVVGGKIALIGNSYQMAYWSESMPFPQFDGFPLYRAVYGESFASINPLHRYPWSFVMRDSRPTVTSAEMSIVYRFHEFIINKFPIKDSRNKTIEEREIFQTAFDAKGYMALGADKVLRGMLATDIPNFKSGVDETFRSAGRYRGNPFDIVTWSIVHEREQGLPTFNQYFQAYAKSEPNPEVIVKIRKRFEDFSRDPQVVAELKRLYKTPDDVDFVVGVQLEEELFPGTTMPVSALIPSLLSLFGVGNSDRFSPAFATMRCILVDRPWDCHPSNALEDLLWEPRPTEEHPNNRRYSSFWTKEMDYQAFGSNLLWRLITENSGAKCVQKNPLFPFDPETNPVLCELPPSDIASYVRKYIPKYDIALYLVGGVVLLLSTWWLRNHLNTNRDLKKNGVRNPPTNWGLPILGVGKSLQSDPYGFVKRQEQNYKGTAFGLRLIGSLVYYICSTPADVDVMMNDEERASLNELTRDNQLGAVVGRHNFKLHLHATVIRKRLDVNAAETLPSLAKVVQKVVDGWMKENEKLLTKGGRVDDFRPFATRLMALVMSRVCLGATDGAYKNPELLQAFIDLDHDSSVIFGVGNLLPGWLARLFADAKVSAHYRTIRKHILPVVQARRKTYDEHSPALDSLLDSFLNASSNDKDVVELVGGIVVGGLLNVADAVTNAIYNVAEKDGLQNAIRAKDDVSHIEPRKPSSSSWNLLRSVTLETLRLAGCVIGPVRKVVVDDFKLGYDVRVVAPKNSGLAASPVLMHYSPDIYVNPTKFDENRFSIQDAAIGTHRFLTFGLPVHTCPGRFFAIEAISITLNTILSRWEVQLVDTPPSEKPEDRYNYSVGSVVMPRKPLKLILTHRS